MPSFRRFVDHQYHDLSREDGVELGTDVDKALDEETAGGWHLWGMYLRIELFH